MQDQPNASLEPTPEQIRYAGFLEKGMYVGLACLLVTFAIYIFEAMEHYIPHEMVPHHWTQSVDQYLADAQIEPGWVWVTMLGHGDFINFIGIAILAGVSVLCYLSIIPLLLKKRDFIYAVIALLEVAVLALAASGLLAVGH